MNLKYINDVNTAALETEILVFKRAFQEKASLFDDILEVSKEAPPQILLKLCYYFQMPWP